MTEGETVADADGASAHHRERCLSVAAWGAHFIMHPAYGRIGSAGVGGLEVIGYNSSAGRTVMSFDSEGNVSSQALLYRDGTWTWQDEHARCTGVFTDGGKSSDRASRTFR